MINSNKMNLGQLLLRQGVLDEDQLAHAMAEHKRTGLMLSKIKFILMFVFLCLC